MLSHLTLTAFRSYAAAQLEFAPGVVLLTGANGAGKTNILEALSLFAPGRGLRRAKLAELQQVSNSAPWAISARLNGPYGETMLGTGRDPATPESERRIVLIDGQKVGQPQLGDHLAVSWITPAMDRLWAESPSGRRRFLDRLTAALDPAHTTRLNRYEDALAERNRLLREGVADAHWLGSIEHTLATEGVAVAAARREMVEQLKAHLSAHPDFPAPLLALEGVETWLEGTPALLVEDRLREELAQSRRLDAVSGITSRGPHRSDLLATHPQKNMPAALGSTGEQKALLISLILAHARLTTAQRGSPPLLLLDEVAAHLDESRRTSLYNTLISLGGQAFLTGADSALFSPLSGRVLCYEIEAGIVRKNPPL